jgi:hypothetical protein
MCPLKSKSAPAVDVTLFIRLLLVVASVAAQTHSPTMEEKHGKYETLKALLRRGCSAAGECSSR